MDEQTTQLTSAKLDYETIREKLSSERGRGYWRSFEELAETPEYRKALEDEFPDRESLLEFDRRGFMKLMGASMLLAGLSGCRSVFLPQEKIVPFVHPPTDSVPGVPMYYATAMPMNGYGLGLVVQCINGRPIKVEGNPKHPSSLGATDVFSQASTLGLYDPDRSQTPLNKDLPSTFDAFNKMIRDYLGKRKGNGEGIAFLTGANSSPTLAAQMASFLAAFPGAKWVQWDPVNRDAVYKGAKMALGVECEPVYDFARASVILSLDADFVNGMPGSVRYARDFADGRRMNEGEMAMNRLYVVESFPTLAGAIADHRFPMTPSNIELFARTLAQRIGLSVSSHSEPKGIPSETIDAIVRDLQKAGSRALVIAGDYASPEVQAIALGINRLLGSIGDTVMVTAPITQPDQNEEFLNLVSEMKAGMIHTLFICDSNPVYSSPGDVPFTDALERVRLKVHFGLYNDETGVKCDWHLPMAHFLESWSDVRAHDGTISIIQPMIAPLFGGHSIHEFIEDIQGKPAKGLEILQSHYRSLAPNSEKAFDAAWRQILHEGLVPSSAGPTINQAGGGMSIPESSSATGLEIIYRPDPCIWDGRFANNGWLQELPKPLTTLTWENVAHMSPATAKQIGVTSEERVKLTYQGVSVDCPVWVMPGHPDNCITVHLGFGRTHAGAVGNSDPANDVNSFDANKLRSILKPYADGGLTAERAPHVGALAITQLHHSMEGRDIVRAGTLSAYIAEPSNFSPDKAAHHGAEAGHSGGHEDEVHEEGAPSMYPHLKQFVDEGPYQWAMTIDLNTCNGCNACVVACQSENNIPVVGKAQVKRSREMHWIRIDRYYRYNGVDQRGGESQGMHHQLMDPGKVETILQPLTCMHCELAPCEPVCPVAATVHSHEGLNQMVYNRCVGTRYCSNNCPYKVRRFNYLNYTDNMKQFSGQEKSETDNKRLLLKMINNPNVTVRGRGVMEKCTYCVQRINAARIAAKKEGREIRDGEFQTACQQACPPRAITFGNLLEGDSAVAKLKRNPRNYVLLEEGNWKPRTTYLAKLRNPNPEIKG